LDESDEMLLVGCILKILNGLVTSLIFFYKSKIARIYWYDFLFKNNIIIIRLFGIEFDDDVSRLTVESLSAINFNLNGKFDMDYDLSNNNDNNHNNNNSDLIISRDNNSIILMMDRSSSIKNIMH
jgi:hypothetical protein